MSVVIKNYGGLVGWYLKKLFPNACSEAYLRMNFLLRRGKTKRFINNFMNSEFVPQPQMVLIETINRCNSTCAFCPANKNDDIRPFVKMSDDDFKKIISDLKDWGFKGMVSLYVNNEPLLDNRIIWMHQYVKDELPDCKIKLFTNGTLLKTDIFKKLIKNVDYFVINNYSDNTHLHSNVREIVNLAKKKYDDKTIIIRKRYIKDVLTNRMGEAPNKGTHGIVKEPCLMPFTDVVIFSNGNYGLCCNDAQEKTKLGNIRDYSVKEIWEDNTCGYGAIRNRIYQGRDKYEMCCKCDFIDTGLRIENVKRNGT